MRFARRTVSLLVWLSLLLGAMPQLATAAPGLSTASANTITVTTSDDVSSSSTQGCALREAVIAANEHRTIDGCVGKPGANSIVLPAGTYQLTIAGANEDAAAQGDLDITSDITIAGAGATQTTIDGSALGDRAFQVLSGGHLTLQNLTVRGGNVRGDGGNILAAGRLDLTNVVVTGGQAGGAGGGIAIDDATFNLTGSTVSQNTAGNGGGIALADSMATIDSSAILANQASGDGGGIYNTRGNLLTVTNSTIAQNTAGGRGGGIASTPEANPKAVSKKNVTNLTNDTLIANTSGPRGGGLDSDGDSTLLNTVFSGNTAKSGAECYASSGHQIQSTGVNFIQNAGGCAISGGSLISGQNPKLEPLGSYGGPTLSYRPLADSPLVDAGTNAGCPATDQRGVKRPGVGTGKAQCDLGSVELSTGVQITDDNTSWPHALNIPLAGTNASSAQTIGGSAQGSLEALGQSRWYKFHVDPSEQVVVTLTGLQDNYDLTLYKDIKQVFLSTQAPQSTQDLAKIGAEFAPDAFTPDAFTPDAFTPDAFTPDAFTPDAFTPDAFTPDAFTPDAFTPDAFTPDAFTPDAFTPDAFTPDAFTPDAFTPDAFTPDAFTSAQTRSLIGVSAFDGTASEGIRVNTWDLSGDFYMRVRGRNGAFDPGVKFTVSTVVATVGCGNALGGLSSLPATSLPVSGSGRTLILYDSARTTIDTQTSLGDLQSALNRFAGLPSVQGVLVDVHGDARVAAANTLADNNTSCPYLKNVVADSIKAIVDNYRLINQSLKYVVIVGGDNAVPFYRYPDQALLGSEKNFVPPVKDTSASQASLKEGYVLSQDKYGTQTNLTSGNTTLPLPQLAVGRLVETSSEIVNMLTAYENANGVVAPQNALVTGYDFVADDACAVKAQLAAGLGAQFSDQSDVGVNCPTPDTGGKIQSLITNNGVTATRGSGPWTPDQPWTADDLKPLLLQQHNDLVFLAGHFSAASALAADFSTRITTADLAAAQSADPNFFSNEIWFSIGCHSGYNTVNPDGITDVTPEPDWAEATAQKGITLIAGTGYQYGDTDFVKYSEQLYLNFATNLHAGSGPIALGDALVSAKLHYLTQTPPNALSGVAVKAFLEATLFGLPMMSVDMPSGRGAQLLADGTLQPLDTGITPAATNPGATLQLSTQDITLNPALTRHEIALTDANNNPYTAVYYSGPDGVVVRPQAPVLPFVSQAIGGNLLVRGAGFLGGDYTDLPDTLPLTGAATTEQGTTHLPFHSSYLYPDVPWSLNYFGFLGGFSPPLLQVTPAQYQSNTPTSNDGTLRLLDSMSFRLFYSNNTQQYPAGGTYPTTADIPALAASPAISQVLATQGPDGSINFSTHVQGDPLAGIQQVWVTFTVIPSGGGAGRWVSLDLTQATADSTLWQASLPLSQVQSTFGTQDLTNFRYMVQAANGVGLVTLNTNLGSYFKVGAPAPNPTVTQLAFNSPPSSGTYGTYVQVSATLSGTGCAANQTVFFGIGAQRLPATTDGSGVATAMLPLAAVPGDTQLQVTFPGTDSCQVSSASTPFRVDKQPSHLSLSGTTLPVTATLTDNSGNPLRQRTIMVVVQGAGGSPNQSVPLTTDQSGKAALASLSLAAGSYTIDAYFGSLVTLPGGEQVDLTNAAYDASTAHGSLTIGGAIGSTSPGVPLAWGRNNEGEIGNGTHTDAHRPVEVSNLTDVSNLAGGDYYSLALKTDGTVWAWGNNGNHYLGNGNNTSSPVPVQVQGLSNISAISARRVTSLALKTDGTVWAWGENGSGQLGIGSTNSPGSEPATPSQVVFPSGTNIVAIAAGAFFNMALDSSGQVWAWGDNGNGQIAQPTGTHIFTTPTPISGLPHIKGIAAGFDSAFAIDDSGNVWAWGGNNNGELGVGTRNDGAHTTPVQLGGLSNVVDVAGYYNHTLAVEADGTVYAWGDNGSGQLGDGTQTPHYIPQPVPGLTHIVQVAVGGYHSLALKSDGTVYGWGDNGDGRVGDGSTTQRHTPQPVVSPDGSAPLSGIYRIAAGDRTSFAVAPPLMADYSGDYLAPLHQNTILRADITPTDVTGANVKFNVFAGYNGASAGEQIVPVDPSGSAQTTVDNSSACGEGSVQDIGPLCDDVYAVETSAGRGTYSSDPLTTFLVVYDDSYNQVVAASGRLQAPSDTGTAAAAIGVYYVYYGEGWYGALGFSLPGQNIEFRSSLMNLTLIDAAAGTAEIDGSGTVNGVSGYTATADVNQHDGTVRVQIFQGDTLVYDSGVQPFTAGGVFVQDR